MADERGADWVRLTQSGPVTDQPALLHGLVLLPSSGGSPVDIYDGVDEGAGRQVGRFKNATNRSLSIQFPKPLRMEAGIYAVLDANVDEVLIEWEPRLT